MADETTERRSIWAQMRAYFDEVRTETRRVTWPGKQEVYGTTVMVIVTTFFFAMVFWVCDETFSRTVSRLLDFLLHHS